MTINQLCAAMSFTARYESVSPSTASPIVDGPLRGDQSVVITGLTAAASIQINEPKPRHIAHMSTVLTNITLMTSSIRVKWKFVVITRNRIKRLSRLASVERARRSLEWVIKVRQYGTLNVRVFHVRDEHNSIDDFLVRNQTYNYTIRGLQPLTAYELCFHSNHIIIDTMNSIVNSHQKPNDICKEIITPEYSGERVVDITMASAISSASTTVIIVVMFCCCRKGNDRSDRSHTSKTNRHHNRRKRFRYQRIWKWMDRSPEQSLMSSSSVSANNSKVAVTRPILNPVVSSHEFYINPEDIKRITAKNVRVFTKNTKPLTPNTNYVPKMRNNISTTSMFRKRYRRPSSWPLIDERTWLKTQSNPNISTNSETNANKLWFHSFSSDFNKTASDQTLNWINKWFRKPWLHSLGIQANTSDNKDPIRR